MRPLLRKALTNGAVYVSQGKRAVIPLQAQPAPRLPYLVRSRCRCFPAQPGFLTLIRTSLSHGHQLQWTARPDGFKQWLHLRLYHLCQERRPQFDVQERQPLIALETPGVQLPRQFPPVIQVFQPHELLLSWSCAGWGRSTRRRTRLGQVRNP